MAKKVITVPVSLPSEVFQDLEKQAGRGCRRVGAFISRNFQSQNRRLRRASTSRPLRISPRFEKVLGIFKGGDPHAGHNGRIDEDLAREAQHGTRRPRR